MIGILGVLNTTKVPRSELLTINGILRTILATSYLVCSYQSGLHHKLTSSDNQLPPVLLDLAFGGWDILTAYPLQSFRLSSEVEDVEIAILGILRKMTGAAALAKVEILVDDDAQQIILRVGVKALGTLGETIFRFAK